MTLTGPELKRRRHLLGLTQAGLARLLGLTATTITRWETGAVPIGFPPMVDLALRALERDAARMPQKRKERAVAGRSALEGGAGASAQ